MARMQHLVLTQTMKYIYTVSEKLMAFNFEINELFISLIMDFPLAMYFLQFLHVLPSLVTVFSLYITMKVCILQNVFVIYSFAVYLTTLPLTGVIQHGMLWWQWIIGKDMEGSDRGLIWGTTLAFTRRGWGKSRKNLRIEDVLAEIQTRRIFYKRRSFITWVNMSCVCIMKIPMWKEISICSCIF
jgi:hypothetical protein